MFMAHRRARTHGCGKPPNIVGTVASPVVAVRGLRMAYDRVVVLEDIDLTVAAGEIVAVTGVNGAGKSTLLTCLAGLRSPAGHCVRARPSATQHRGVLAQRGARR